MNMDQLRRHYQAGLAVRSAAKPAVTVEQLEALASHRLSETEAMALLDRVMADDGLRREYELLRSVHEAGRVPSPARRWMPLALAASLLLAVSATYLVQRVWLGGEGEMRGPSAQVALVSPADQSVLPLPVTLAWRPVAGAVRYRVELLDGIGEPTLSEETTDTTFVVPFGGVASGMPYRWWVEVIFPSSSTRSAPRTITFSIP
ncbi:MAG: hypothetical protein E4H41_05015 [Gemmatimonadales bacterium]|nr:MAG: hypothetical protein E4H41_05015 [Gemmatimonadales bacterium]